MSRWPIALVFLVIGGAAGAVLTNSALQGQAPSPPPVFPKELSSYREVVKVVLPAVVSVRSEVKPVAKQDRQGPQRQRPRIETIPGIPDEFRKFFEEMQPGFEFGSPEDFPRESFGSGFIIDPKGIILTNYHVVAGATKVRVALKDGTVYTSTDIKGDRKNDLAIIRIEPRSSLPYLEFGDSDAMEIGDRVLAVGAPFGLTGSVTSGIVSAKGRSGLNMERTVFEDYLQTDAALNQGNSGGPLVNLEGKVIGVSTAIKSRTGGFQGVGLAITSNLAKNIAQQLVRDGVVHRGYLGVTVSPLDAEVAARLGVQEKGGVFVSKVMEGTPAAKAGIRETDIITSVAGKPVADGRELQRIIGSLPIKKPVDIHLNRESENMVVQAIIEEQPDNYGVQALRTGGAPRSSEQEAEDISVERFGMDVAELTQEMANRYGYKEDAGGVIITNVQPGSEAAEAGLTRGVLIVKIEKKPVTSATSVRDLLQKADPEKGVLVQVEYPPRLGGGTAYRLLKPEPATR